MKTDTKTDSSDNQGTRAAYTQPVAVGCDDGYAAIKLAFLNGDAIQQLSIPSRAAVGDKLTTQTQGGSDDATYTTDDLTYTVSEYLKTEDTRFHTYPMSALNRVLVHHALRKAGLGARQIQLATSLPPGDYYRSSGQADSIITQKQRSLLKPLQAADNRPTAMIQEHRVYSEAAAALIDYCVDAHGNVRHDIEDPIAVIDIGGQTTDCLTVLPPGNQVDQQRSGTNKVGVLDVIDAVRQQVLESFPNVPDVNQRKLEATLRTKTITLYGETHDVRTEVDQALEVVSKQLYLFIEKTLKNVAEFEQLLFVGGGAEVMRPVISTFPQAYIPDDPQFANARGMLKMMLMDRNTNG